MGWSGYRVQRGIGKVELEAYSDFYEYAKFELKLSKPRKDGKTERWHLENAEKALKRIIPELIPPKEMPLFLVHVWRHFLHLDDARQIGMAINPISYCEIDSYCRLTNVKMSVLEVDAIKKLDRIKREVMNDSSN